MKRWVRYVEKHCKDKTQVGKCIERENKIERNLQDDPILRSEFDEVLEEMKAGKAVEVNKFVCEFIEGCDRSSLKKPL